ncbi:MAG: alkaline phosphatase family protein [Deltaproteobacteria bacterium]
MSTAIDHVVVMVMENRSFDHLLGYFTNIIPGLQCLGCIVPRARRRAISLRIPRGAAPGPSSALTPGYTH